MFSKTSLVNIEYLDFDYKNVDVELGYDMRGFNVDNCDGVGGQIGANVGGFVVGVDIDIGANIGGFADGDGDGVEKGIGFYVAWVVL